MKTNDSKNTRIQAYVDSDRCDGCALCIDVCTAEALRLTANVNRPGKRIVRVDHTACVGCGLCQGTCPKEAVSVTGYAPSALRRKICEALERS
jgi:NAD-dependent dihydropyrimidine dehydrogenase PreA subunit